MENNNNNNNNNNNTVSKVRFVRCPKCLELLAEFSHVPVYRCGSCGMILKAKNSNFLGQNQNQNQNLMEKSVENCVELDDGGKGESLENERIGVNEGNKAEEVIEESRVNTGSSEEDCNGGSVSCSSDNTINGVVPNKYRLLSKRTFRNSDPNQHKGSISASDVVGITNSFAAKEINPSFDSEDFHSVQNLMEGVNVDKQSSVKCQKVGTSTEFNSFEFHNQELMKRIDEIRDKVDILIDRTVNKERRSNLRGNRKFINCPPRELNQLCSNHRNAFCQHPEEPNSRHCKTERKDDDEHRKLISKEKKPANKKLHYLPVQRGAPFVICSECMNVLHLPPDFLVSNKLMHKLRCGACSKVLIFTFRARVRAGSSSAAEQQHPPTEASASNSNVSSFAEQRQQFSLDQSYSLENSSPMKIERRCSSLHQLMGYDSASELLRLRSYSSQD